MDDWQGMTSARTGERIGACKVYDHTWLKHVTDNVRQQLRQQMNKRGLKKNG